MAPLVPPPGSGPARRPKRVAIVNGSVNLLAWLEPVLDAGDYDIQFLDPEESPLAQIRVSQPDLVVLTLRIEDLEAFNLLSMLKMDPDTSRIQILTYTTEYEGQPLRYSLGDLPEEGWSASMPALPLN